MYVFPNKALQEFRNSAASCMSCLLNCTKSRHFSCNSLQSGLHGSKPSVCPFLCTISALQLGRWWHRAVLESEEGYLISFHPQLTSGTEEPRGQAQLLLFLGNPLILLTALSGNLCLGSSPKEEGIDGSDALTIGQIFACNHLG